MTLTRVIPCLDIKDGRVVKGINFVGLVDSGDPVELGMAYSVSGADELVFLDITATSDCRAPVIDLVHRVAENVFIPFTVGGGVRSVEDVSKALKAGADKVSLNSAAVKNPDLVRQCSQAFGAQCITVAVDAKRHGDGWHVYTAGGRHDEGLDVLEWVEQVQALGAGEILLTSMDRDGTKTGCDNNLNLAVSNLLTIPVIASGGVGTAKDAAEAILVGHADAVLVAGILHTGTTTVQEIKRGMKESGLNVRL